MFPAATRGSSRPGRESFHCCKRRANDVLCLVTRFFFHHRSAQRAEKHGCRGSAPLTQFLDRSPPLPPPPTAFVRQKRQEYHPFRSFCVLAFTCFTRLLACLLSCSALLRLLVARHPRQAAVAESERQLLAIIAQREAKAAYYEQASSCLDGCLVHQPWVSPVRLCFLGGASIL